MEKLLNKYRDFVNETSKNNLHGDEDHAILGMCSEVGELADIAKKSFKYDFLKRRGMYKDELGDVFWYFTLMCNAFGINLKDIIEFNIKKLEERNASRR